MFFNKISMESDKNYTNYAGNTGLALGYGKVKAPCPYASLLAGKP